MFQSSPIEVRIFRSIRAFIRRANVFKLRNTRSEEIYDEC